ncbi:electron transfer flavoprotein subunit beta, partial [bacterium 210820-DFI.6.52]|nr:electron transfer flavoprotein subunit beta [bacterium 210820-DFI.6.52]
AVKELNEPRHMSVDKIVKAFKTEVKVWTIDDLDVNREEVGLKASPTKVFKSFTPDPRGKREILKGNPE